MCSWQVLRTLFVVVIFGLVFAVPSFADCKDGHCTLRHPVVAAKAVVATIAEKVEFVITPELVVGSCCEKSTPCCEKKSQRIGRRLFCRLRCH